MGTAHGPISLLPLAPWIQDREENLLNLFVDRIHTGFVRRTWHTGQFFPVDAFKRPRRIARRKHIVTKTEE